MPIEIQPSGQFHGWRPCGHCGTEVAYTCGLLVQSDPTTHLRRSVSAYLLTLPENPMHPFTLWLSPGFAGDRAEHTLAVEFVLAEAGSRNDLVTMRMIDAGAGLPEQVRPGQLDLGRFLTREESEALPDVAEVWRAVESIITDIVAAIGFQDLNEPVH